MKTINDKNLGVLLIVLMMFASVAFGRFVGHVIHSLILLFTGVGGFVIGIFFKWLFDVLKG